MNRRALFILGAATLAAALGAVWAVSRSDRADRVQDQPVAAFPDLARQGGDLARVTIVGNGSRVSLARGADKVWTVEDLANYPAKADAVNRLFVDLSTMTLIERRSARKEARESLGLVPPAEGGSGLEITAFDGTGKLLAAIMQGKAKDYGTSGTVGTLYVRKLGEDQAWFARSNLQAARQPLDWVDKVIVETSRARIAQATARPGAPDALTVVRASPDAIDFTVPDLPKGRELANPAIAGGFGAAALYVNFEDVKPRGQIDLAGAQKTIYRTFDGLVLTFETKRIADKAWIVVSASVDEARLPEAKTLKEKAPELKDEAAVRDEVAALNAKAGAWVFQITNAKADDLTTTLVKLLKKPEASKAEPARAAPGLGAKPR